MEIRFFLSIKVSSDSYFSRALDKEVSIVYKVSIVGGFMPSPRGGHSSRVVESVSLLSHFVWRFTRRRVLLRGPQPTWV